MICRSNHGVVIQSTAGIALLKSKTFQLRLREQHLCQEEIFKILLKIKKQDHLLITSSKPRMRYKLNQITLQLKYLDQMKKN